MKNLTLKTPVKFETVERWIVYIIDQDGLASGDAGEGGSPKEATENAQAKIDDIRKEKLQEP